MTATRRTLTALLLAPAFALAACGGSDADDIKDVIQDVAKDSSKICEHATDKLLKQLGGGDAEACKEFARAYPDENPGEIKGDIDVKVDGDKATAKFTDTQGEKQDVGFVKEDGKWKVDSP